MAKELTAREIILYQVMRFADPADMDVGNWDICTDNILKAFKENGLVVVPVEPTARMVDAGVEASDKQRVAPIYRAMVYAAQGGVE